MTISFGKAWGQTTPLLKTPLIEIHSIIIEPNTKCSVHKHEHKWNAFFVLEGILEIHVQKNDYELIDVTHLGEEGFTTVPPNEYHWFENNSTSQVRALEVYYLSPLSEDIIRKNVGGPIIK